MSYRAFSLFDVGHAFKEVKNITCLKLFKFLRRLFDPYDVVKDFTTAVKVRVFSGEEYLFDDMFQEKCSFKDILNLSQTQFSPEEFQEFKVYRERTLTTIPLDNLRLEPAKEPTPSVSLSGSSDSERSKSKSDKEISEHSKKSDQDKSEGSVKDTAQSKELSQQQTSTTPQLNIPPLNVQQPSISTQLDKECESFNDLINVEGQNIQTPVQIAKVLVTEISGNVIEK